MALVWQADMALRHGPGRDVDAFVKSLQQLHDAMVYLQGMEGLAVAEEAHAHTERVRPCRGCPRDPFLLILHQAYTNLVPCTSRPPSLGAHQSLA